MKLTDDSTFCFLIYTFHNETRFAPTFPLAIDSEAVLFGPWMGPDQKMEWTVNINAI